jgi:hypothetical protein
MHSLNLPSGKLLLHAQIQANEGKGQSDWLGMDIRVLRCERIHDMLVNKGRIAMR